MPIIDFSLSEGKELWCSCEKNCHTFPELTNHYSSFFLPDHWLLKYDTLYRAQERTLFLAGRCQKCHRSARAGVSIPSDLVGPALLEHIYKEMLRYRPFDGKNEDTGTYRGAVSERSRWYIRQDDLGREDRDEQFVALFHAGDQPFVRRWLAKRDTTEEYVKPRRDRKSTLLQAILGRARADGSMEQIDGILDYILPNSNEPEWPESDSQLTDYHFNIVPQLEYGGSEGIFVTLRLEGSFDDTDRTSLTVGLFKTLHTDLAACRLMGQLCGLLLHHGTAYVNENIHRYTPEKQLLLEQERNRKTKSERTETT